MNKQKPRLYLSCNLFELSRCYDLRQSLRQVQFPFEDVTVGIPQTGSIKDRNHYFKSTVREEMMNTDWYIVMADQYTGSFHQPWVDIEMNCAFFLDIPVVVLQPWSCWSVPSHLQTHAYRIIDWPCEDVASNFMNHPDSLSGNVKFA